MSSAIDGCNWDYCMQLSEPVYPTPFYEIMMMLGVFGILWMLRKRIRIHGVLFFIYLCLIAVERFAIEKNQGKRAAPGSGYDPDASRNYFHCLVFDRRCRRFMAVETRPKQGLIWLKFGADLV